MKIYAAIFSVLLQIVLFADASAAVVELVGTKVTFRFDGVEAGLFNHWQLSLQDEQDALQLFPTDFSAGTTSPGIAIAEQGLVVSISANSGFVLNSVALRQQGVYSRWGNIPAALTSTASGASVSGAFTVGSTTVALESDTDMEQGNVGSPGPASFAWSLNRAVSVAPVSVLTVSLFDTLFAYSAPSEGLGYASIQNSLSQISALAEAVPVDLPSSLPLLGTALLAVILIGPKGAKSE